jgi:hypothetical protein
MVRYTCLTVLSILFLAVTSRAADPSTDSDSSGEQIKRHLRQAEDDIKQLIKQLDDESYEKRERAVRELTKIGEPALPLLRAAANDKDSLEAQLRIAKLIEKLTPKPAWPEILNTKIHISPEKAKIFEDQKTTIQEALDWLASEYGFNIRCNAKAFELVGGKAEDRLTVSLIGEKGPMPVFVQDVTLAVWLHEIIDRMGGEAGGSAKMMIRKDHLEITTADAQESEILEGHKLFVKFPALVTVSFDKRPFNEVLEELGDRSGLSIILDTPSVKDAGKALITARFVNAPVDTAVRLSANMANLSVYEMDNVIYVTTADKAEALEKEQERLIKKGRIKYPRGGAKPEPDDPSVPRAN